MEEEALASIYRCSTKGGNQKEDHRPEFSISIRAGRRKYGANERKRTLTSKNSQMKWRSEVFPDAVPMNLIRRRIIGKRSAWL